LKESKMKTQRTWRALNRVQRLSRSEVIRTAKPMDAAPGARRDDPKTSPIKRMCIKAIEREFVDLNDCASPRS